MTKEEAIQKAALDWHRSKTPTHASEFIFNAALDWAASQQQPFCYMSESYEIGLFSEPPKEGSEFADMFPVYKNAATSQKMPLKLTQLERDQIAMCCQSAQQIIEHTELAVWAKLGVKES